MTTSVRVYLDLSNIICGARDAGPAHLEQPGQVRVHAEALRDLLAAGRRVASATAVLNSSMPELTRRRFGQFFELIEVERGLVSGRDQAADEQLQLAMYRDLLEPQLPGVVVLATGDGAGWARRRGFTQPLLRARERGFGIEVASFSSSLHPKLRRLAEMPLNALVDLDRHYPSITFEQGGSRFPFRVDLRDRPVASARPWVDGELDWLTPDVALVADELVGQASSAAGDVA